MNAPTPRTTYDQDADALYLYFAPIAKGAVVETREVAPGVLLDFDGEVGFLGIEALNASKRLPDKAIPTAV